MASVTAVSRIAGLRPVSLSKATSRPAYLGALQRPLPSLHRVSGPARGAIVTHASEKPADFDALLMQAADKFEKAENKPVIVAWGVAGISAFIISEWLIHLPVLNVLLGFPIQLLGLLALPYLGVRWFVDGNDYYEDISNAASDITDKLPGLKK